MYKDTKLLDNSEESINYSAEVLKAGGLVVFPTETVYGIGASIYNDSAVKAIFEAKGRPQDNPLIVHVACISQAKHLVKSFSFTVQKLAKAFWPGPLTLVLPKTNLVSDIVSGGLDTVAIRIPNNPIALSLIEKSGLPLAAPSANTSGKPSPTTALHSFEDLRSKVDVVIDGGKTQIGVESTVLSLTSEVPMLLRPGGITIGEIEKIIGSILVSDTVLSNVEDSRANLSPGTRYKHYAPKAEAVLVHGSTADYVKFCSNLTGNNIWAMAFDEDIKLLQTQGIPAISYGSRQDEKEQASNIFRVLRELDEKSSSIIVIHAPNNKGIGLAVYNRLLRATNFNVKWLNSEEV